jgi:hypothetical protein
MSHTSKSGPVQALSFAVNEQSVRVIRRNAQAQPQLWTRRTGSESLAPITHHLFIQFESENRRQNARSTRIHRHHITWTKSEQLITTHPTEMRACVEGSAPENGVQSASESATDRLEGSEAQNEELSKEQEKW